MQIENKRTEIDALDEAIVDLLNRRAVLAKDISIIKFGAGLPIVDERREHEVLQRLKQANEGAIDDMAITRIYRTILIESRRIQSTIWSELSANGVRR